MILLTLVVGQVADRCDRRLIVAVCEIVKAATAAALALGAVGGWQSRTSIFMLVALLGAAQAFENPAMSALVPEVVARPLIAPALARARSGVPPGRAAVGGAASSLARGPPPVGAPARRHRLPPGLRLGGGPRGLPRPRRRPLPAHVPAVAGPGQAHGPTEAGGVED